MPFLPRFKPLRLSSPAQRDLQAIANYTQAHWGDVQKVAYLALFHQSFVSLSTQGNMGKQRDDIAVGLYAYTVKSHCIYFRETATDFVVVRILHSRMDVALHLT